MTTSSFRFFLLLLIFIPSILHAQLEENEYDFIILDNFEASFSDDLGNGEIFYDSRNNRISSFFKDDIELYNRQIIELCDKGIRYELIFNEEEEGFYNQTCYYEKIRCNVKPIKPPLNSIHKGMDDDGIDKYVIETVSVYSDFPAVTTIEYNYENGFLKSIITSVQNIAPPGANVILHKIEYSNIKMIQPEDEKFKEPILSTCSLITPEERNYYYHQQEHQDDDIYVDLEDDDYFDEQGEELDEVEDEDEDEGDIYY